MNKAEGHPGALLEPLVLEPGACSQSQLARMLGFNQPQPVNELINGKRNITPKMALLLERATGGAYPAEFWLLAQLRWDVDQARKGLSPSRLGLVQSLALDSEGEREVAPPLLSLLGLAEELRASRAQQELNNRQ